MIKKFGLIMVILGVMTVSILGCTTTENPTADVTETITETPATAQPTEAPATETMEPAEEVVQLPDTTVVATVDGQEINLGDYRMLWENMKAQYGIDTTQLGDATYSAVWDELRNTIIETIVGDVVIEKALIDLGYFDLSEDEMALAEEKAQEEMQYFLDANHEQLISTLDEGYTEEDLKKAQDEYVAQVLGMMGLASMDDLVQIYVKETAVKNAKDALIGTDLVPDEQMIQDKYNEYLEMDKADYGDDATQYILKLSQVDYTLYYVPEGVRQVRHVLVGINMMKATEISSMRNQGDDKNADRILEEELALIQEEANEVLAKLESGDITFQEAIDQYNDDPGMKPADAGYLISDGNTMYVPAFTEAAMKLENVGDITGLVATDYGYHIILYDKDISHGAIDLEEVREELLEELSTTIYDQAWLDLIDAWMEQYNVDIDYDMIQTVR